MNKIYNAEIHDGHRLAPEVQIEKLLDNAVSKLQEEKACLVKYARIKLDAGDWHAVADAAMDLREIDAKLSVLKG